MVFNVKLNQIFRERKKRLKELTVQNITDDCIVRYPGSIKGEQFIIKNIKVCLKCHKLSFIAN